MTTKRIVIKTNDGVSYELPGHYRFIFSQPSEQPYEETSVQLRIWHIADIDLVPIEEEARVS